MNNVGLVRTVLKLVPVWAQDESQLTKFAGKTSRTVDIQPETLVLQM